MTVARSDWPWELKHSAMLTKVSHFRIERFTQRSRTQHLLHSCVTELVSSPDRGNCGRVRVPVLNINSALPIRTLLPFFISFCPDSSIATGTRIGRNHLPDEIVTRCAERDMQGGRSLPWLRAFGVMTPTIADDWTS